jgi:NADH:ubiquinone reductase (H+-translocating)
MSRPPSSASAQPTRVVCLGGGWGGLYFTRALRGAIKRGEVELTVVSRDNFHTFHGFIPEMLVGRIQPNQVIAAGRQLFRPATYHNAEIEKIDTDAQVVTTSRLLDGRQYELPYDKLFVAVGSLDALHRVPGLAEHGFRLRTFLDTLRIRNHLINVLEMAEIEPDPEERRRLLTFVIAGGNYGGVEVAAELEDYFRVLSRKLYPGIRPEEVRVCVVHSGERILPELVDHEPRLVDWAEKYLAKSGIEFRLGCRLAAASPEEAVLSDGERIPTRTIISCIGSAMSPLLDHIPGERDEQGRLICDANCRVQGFENIWAAGDCARVPDPRGGTVPPLAVYAMQVGRTAGRNVARAVKGRPPEPYRFTGLGDAVALGRRRAVAHVKGIRLYGIPAWITWRLFLLGFIPAWDRKIRLLVDWALTPIFGREVASTRTPEPMGLAREHYEAGQAIVREGEIGRRLYVIVEGEVEVVQSSEDGDTRVATLGPGSHFGEAAVFEGKRRTATIRALTPVELFSMGRDEANTLSSSISSFGEHVRLRPDLAAERAAQSPPKTSS